MSDAKSFSKNFWQAILPRSIFEDMKKESMAWTMQWKAAGNPKTSRPCMNCGQLNWHVIYRK